MATALTVAPDGNVAITLKSGPGPLRHAELSAWMNKVGAIVGVAGGGVGVMLAAAVPVADVLRVAAAMVAASCSTPGPLPDGALLGAHAASRQNPTSKDAV